MTSLYQGPAGILLPASLPQSHRVADVRKIVAEAAYASASIALKKIGWNAADVLAFYSVACATALLDEEDRDAAAQRVAAFKRFSDLPFDVFEGVKVLACTYGKRLERAGWDRPERQEALKGMSSALMTLAHQAAVAPTVHHVDPMPHLRAVGFPRLVDRLVFGLEPAATRRDAFAVVDTAATPTLSNEAVEAPAPVLTEPWGDPGPTVAETIEGWLDARGLHGSERARRGSSARLFMIATGREMGEPVATLADLDGCAAAAYARLSDTVGGGWGTVAAKFVNKTAAEIIEAATTSPVPKWAQRPLAPKGRRGRFDHVIDLLVFVRDSGVDVPHMDWTSQIDGHAA